MDVDADVPSMNVLSVRSLPSASELMHGSCCPTMDLVALKTQGENRLSLWRMSGTAAKAWECSTGANVESLAWSPDGQLLALGLDERIALHSLHTGIAYTMHIPLDRSNESDTQPPRKRRRIATLEWQPLPWPKSVPPQPPSYARELIERLPTLPSPTRDAKQASGAFSATSALAPLGNVASSTRSAADTARHDYGVVSAALPRLARSPLRAAAVDPLSSRSVHRRSEMMESVMLAAFEESNEVELLLGGSVSLGSIALPEGSNIISAQLLERGPSDPATPALRVGVVYSLNNDVMHSVYVLANFPSPSLERIVSSATSVSRQCSHAFIAMEEAKRSFSDAQKMWIGWLEKVAPEDIEGVHERVRHGSDHLVRFLATGRANGHLREFLISKLTERTLAKCEQAMASAYAQLGALVNQHIGPSLERVTLELEEALGWALCANNAEPLLALDPIPIRRAIDLAGALFRAAMDLERLILHEWQGFTELRKWLRTEVDRATAVAASAAAQVSMSAQQRVREREREKTSKPAPALFAHDAVVVAAYLQDHGYNAESIIDALGFDPAQASSPWDDELPPVLPPAPVMAAPSWTEVKAALDSRKSGQNVPLRKLRARDRSVFLSLPHLFAELVRVVGIALGRPLLRIGANARLNGKPEKLQSSQSIASLHIAARPLEDGSHVVAIYSEEPEHELKLYKRVADLRLGIGTVELRADSIADMSFFDDTELAVLLRRSTTARLATFDLTSAWEEEGPIARRDPLRSHALGTSQQMPRSCDVNGRPGRRVGCVLSHDGRTLQVIDMDVGDDERHDDEGDATLDAPPPASTDEDDGDKENDDTMQM